MIGCFPREEGKNRLNGRQFGPSLQSNELPVE